MAAVAEVFGNRPSTTVTSGGTTAPSSGTPETWIVASTASFPAITAGITQYRIQDSNAPAEIVLVTSASGVAPGTLSVTRGAENSTPVAHSVPFPVYQDVSAGVFGSFAQQQTNVEFNQVAGGPGTYPSGETGVPAGVFLAPANPDDDIVVIADDPANPRAGSAQMWKILDKSGIPIFAVPPAGGPRTFGDFFGCWLNVTTPTVQMTPWGGLQLSVLNTTPGAGGPTIYGGSGNPLGGTVTAWMQDYTSGTGQLVTANAGDLWIRQDGTGQTYLWQCTVAGTSSPSPGGSWTPVAPQGLQFLTGGGTITTATITAAANAGYQGIYLDPKNVWQAGGLVIEGISNFIIASDMVGSIGYNGVISWNNQGYVNTGSGADGIQVFGTSGSATAGIHLRGLALVGTNSNSLVHMGGRQRRCGMEKCFAYNTGTVTVTVGTASAGVNVASLGGTVFVSSVAPLATSGQVLTDTANQGLPGLALISYSGVQTSPSPALTGTSLAGGAGTLVSGNLVAPPQAAVIVDTALANFNSEDQSFSRCDFATATGIAVGIDLAGNTQHANDTRWNDITTASAGFASVAGLGGGGHQWELYDRSAAATAPPATVWNHASTMIFNQGEDQNNAAAGVSHLVDGPTAKTVIQSRNMSVGSGSGPVATVTGGVLVSRGVCRWSGTFNLAGGTADVSDPAGVFAGLNITGSSGTLATAARYPAGSPPNVSAWTGPVVTAVGSGGYLCPPAVYAPATTGTLSVTSSTLSAVSSANVNTGAFIVPPSGAVVVRTGFIITNSAANNAISFGLSAHGTTSTVYGNVWTGEISSTQIHQFGPLEFPVSNLTPGTSYTMDLCGAISSGTLNILALGTQAAGTQGGPVTMTVQAV